MGKKSAVTMGWGKPMPLPYHAKEALATNSDYLHPDSREARRLRKRKQTKLNRKNK